MKQQATVERINGREAVILVQRRSACACDCSACTGCAHPEESIRVVAINRAGAMPGDVVMVESDSGTVLGMAAMLYLMPLMTMGLGYGIGDKLFGFTGEVVPIAISFIGLGVGIAICAALSRKLKGKGRMKFIITRVIKE